MFDEQIDAQAGVDFFIGELFFDLGEALLCLDRIKAKTSLPAMITIHPGNAGCIRRPVAFRCTDETPWFTGLPSFPDRLEPTQLIRFDMGDFARRAREMGVNCIGGCCGCKATHIREMAKALGRHTEQQRWQADLNAPMSETEYNAPRRQAQSNP